MSIFMLVGRALMFEKGERGVGEVDGSFVERVVGSNGFAWHGWSLLRAFFMTHSEAWLSV